MIDGKRSQDRSWRCVWAEIRGNKLKLTIHREGKSSQVSQHIFFLFIYIFLIGWVQSKRCLFND